MSVPVPLLAIAMLVLASCSESQPSVGDASQVHQLYAASPQGFRRQERSDYYSGAFATDARRDEFIFGFRDSPLYSEQRYTRHDDGVSRKLQY